jgi:hypothetical protein
MGVLTSLRVVLSCCAIATSYSRTTGKGVLRDLPQPYDQPAVLQAVSTPVLSNRPDSIVTPPHSSINSQSPDLCEVQPHRSARCLWLSSVHDATTGYNWTALPSTAAGTGYTALMCRQGAFVTSLTAYVSSNHYSNTGNPNYLGARRKSTLTAVLLCPTPMPPNLPVVRTAFIFQAPAVEPT